MTQHTSQDLFRLLHEKLEADAERTRKIQERLKGLWAEAGMPNGHKPAIAKVEKIKRGAGIYTRTPGSRAKQARAMRAYWKKKRREQGRG